jgi:hypothetical protein
MDKIKEFVNNLLYSIRFSTVMYGLLVLCFIAMILIVVKNF